MTASQYAVLALTGGVGGGIAGLVSLVSETMLRRALHARAARRAATRWASPDWRKADR